MKEKCFYLTLVYTTSLIIRYFFNLLPKTSSLFFKIAINREAKTITKKTPGKGKRNYLFFPSFHNIISIGSLNQIFSNEYVTSRMEIQSVNKIVNKHSCKMCCVFIRHKNKKRLMQKC